MTPTAKSALLLAGVGIVALILTWTDALAPVADPTPTTVAPTTVAPTPSNPTTTTTEVQQLVPGYLRDIDESILLAPLSGLALPACTELRSSLASVIVESSDPGARTFNIRVTNESDATCRIEVDLGLAFSAPAREGEAALAVPRVHPPPGPNTRYSYRDPVLEPGRSATFSVLATTVEFVPTADEFSAVTIEGPAGILARVDLPSMRVVTAEHWSGPNSGSGTPLDPSSFLVPLPPDDIPPCEAATSRVHVPPDAGVTGTSETPLVVSNDGAEACGLPTGLTLRQAGDDAREIPRSAPTSGTYVSPVIPAGGRVRLMIVGAGEEIAPPGRPDDQTDDVVLRFPDGAEVVVDVELDISQLSAVSWYGPIETPDGGIEE